MTSYQSYLEELLNHCPPAGQGVHPWLFKVARYLHRYHSADEICRILEERVAHCGRVLQAHEIPDAVKNSGAHSWTPASERRAKWLNQPTLASPTRRVPKFDPATAESVAAQIPLEISPEWLKNHSPRPTCCSTCTFLSTVFEPQEKVLVFFDCRSRGLIYPNPILAEKFNLKYWDGVWFLSNPVDGLDHWNPRTARQSRRSEEAIISFRYAVLESDLEPREKWRPLWLKILVGLRLPIVAITNSGGRSDHALVRVDAHSKATWDDFKVRHLRPLVELGADNGALSAVRLTRLPGCFRGDHCQELLYFNPAATGSPIFSL